jgi:NAD(P)-dependent dehydrogenase (short-subunit alcohol dehydrogenase family)|tara:strand:+ start:536 stop:946 length:411 start_codon:yes stop_codon:yes gene_type:complete
MTATHSLAGRTCLVTGASSGIGAHLARAIAAADARVVLGARRTALTEKIASEIRRDGGEALAVPMDVTSEKSVAQAFSSAEGAFGPVDTVIANAGVSRHLTLDRTGRSGAAAGVRYQFAWRPLDRERRGACDDDGG